MRAVNLIPTERRRGGGGAAGKSGGAAYVLLGALALLVVMTGAFVMSGRKLDDKKAELTQVTQSADAAQAKANQLAPYTQFSTMRQKRVETVKSLASSRFDWAHALHEVARVIPENAWLTTMVGTVTPGISLESGGTQTGSLRSAVQAPAIEISGCTTSQTSVARMMARMRLIDGVQRVSLAASEKGDSGSGGASGGATSGDCRNGSDRFPKFELVVFYKPGGTPAVQPAAVKPTQSAAIAAANGETPAAPTPALQTPATGGSK